MGFCRSRSAGSRSPPHGGPRPGGTHDEPFQLWLTGVHDGRRYTQYLPGWPAAMAVTDLLAGSSRLAAALSVGALVPAVYGFALQLLRRRRTAMLAAILSAITPLFLLHGALRLSYVFTTLLLLLFGWALLRADDLDQPGTAALAGVAWGGRPSSPDRSTPCSSARWSELW